MKKILFLFITCILLVSCGNPEVVVEQEDSLDSLIPVVDYEDVNIESLGNRYDGVIVDVQGTIMSGEHQGKQFMRQDIVYSVDKKSFRNYFLAELRPAFDWIVDNTPEDAIFLNWWDYGHMIRGYTGREVVVYSPSEDLLWSLASGQWDVSGSGDFSSDELISDVLFGLLFDAGRTAVVMNKYYADYVFVVDVDLNVFGDIIVYKLGLYSDLSDEDRFAKIQDSVIAKMLEESSINGFELVYTDNFAKIYKKN
ncbi:MAG: hypothetical protein KKF89_00175 [Nanoarchaeota archaeon]|nr:hypothetical protein [Nanoarchaeota archaeon]MBU1854112.1 hypothetical protein [Nanoarchaeota archaeon]